MIKKLYKWFEKFKFPKWFLKNVLFGLVPILALIPLDFFNLIDVKYLIEICTYITIVSIILCSNMFEKVYMICRLGLFICCVLSLICHGIIVQFSSDVNFEIYRYLLFMIPVVLSTIILSYLIEVKEWKVQLEEEVKRITDIPTPLSAKESTETKRSEEGFTV